MTLCLFRTGIWQWMLDYSLLISYRHLAMLYYSLLISYRHLAMLDYSLLISYRHLAMLDDVLETNVTLTSADETSHDIGLVEHPLNALNLIKNWAWLIEMAREMNLKQFQGIIIWSRDTLIFRGSISRDNSSVVRDRNNLSVLILNILRIRDVIIYNLMTLHSYHNTGGNIWKITGQFTQVKCSASKVCQWIFSNSFYQLDNIRYRKV